jgi:hypothetical protein
MKFNITLTTYGKLALGELFLWPEDILNHRCVSMNNLNIVTDKEQSDEPVYLLTLEV